AAGGALGGLFVSIIAPLIFKTFFEWKLGLVGGYTFALALLGWAHGSRSSAAPTVRTTGRADLCLASGLLPLVLAILVGVPDLCGFLRARRIPLCAARNFYGVVCVYQARQSNPSEATHVFVSGNVKHGIQFTSPTKQREPTTYFGRQSG